MTEQLKQTDREKQVLTIREAAKRYGFPEFGLRNLIKRGAFPTIACGNRHYITVAVIERFIETGGEAYAGRV
jgi:hypothetical protein